MSGKGFNVSDISRDELQLFGPQAKNGYDWWWHSFTAKNEKTGKKKAFFIEFFLCNPALSESCPILGQNPENKRKGKKPSYLMVKAGAWGRNAAQLHRFFSWDETFIRARAPFGIRADDCLLTEVRTKGSVCVTGKDLEDNPGMMCECGEMSWNLKINKKIAFNVGYGAGELFRKLQAFNMFWHAEGMKTEYEGWVIFNGRKYIVEPEDCFGYADKNWGKDFTSPWVWLSSCNLTSMKTGRRLKNSAFDIGGGCPQVGPIRFERKLLSALWYEGVPYEFNFSKFWTFTKTEFECTETEDEIIWHVDQSNLTSRMVTDIRCAKRDMLLVQYEAPDGQKRHNRLFNGGNGTGKIKLYRHGRLVDAIAAKNVGCEYGEYSIERKNPLPD